MHQGSGYCDMQNETVQTQLLTEADLTPKHALEITVSLEMAGTYYIVIF